MANLTPDELPIEGEIDRQRLRDKWSGRTAVFFNQSNSGGQRSARSELAWEPPALETDPAVRYRTFHGKEAVDEFIRTGVLRGGWNENPNLPSSLFFNQGQPLWSYAGTPEAAKISGRDRYLIGTLGDEWGNRGGYSPTMYGGTRLNEAEAVRAKPTSVTFPAFEKANLIKNRLTEADLIESTNALTRNLTSYPTLQEDGSYLAGDPDAPISQAGKDGIKKWIEQLRSGVANVTSGIGAPKETYNLLYDNTGRGGLPHPLLQHRELLIDHIDSALHDVLTARMRQDRGGREFDLSEDPKDALEKAAYKYTKRFLEPKGQRNPFTSLTMLEDAMGGLKVDRAFQTISELENYFRTFYDVNELQGASTISPRPTNLEFDALKGQKGRGIDFYSSSVKPPAFSEFVDASGNPVNPQVPLLTNLHTYIQRNLNTEPVSLGPIDDKSFQSPSDVSANLINALKQPIYSQALHHGTQAWEPWDQLRFDRMGIEGAMYSEAIPLSQIPAQGFGYDNYEIREFNSDISASNLKRWQLPAHSLNSNASKRPFAVWKINPDHPDGIELVHEVNNDTLPEGYKPIPTGLMRPNAIPEAVARYEQETGMTPFGPTGKLAPDTGLLAASILLNPKLESDYLRIQSLIGEATKGNPSYGRKGFVDMNLLLAPYRPFVNVAKGLTEEDQFMAMMRKGLSSPRGASNFASHYVNDPAIRSYVNGNMVNSTVNALGKVGAGFAIATAPSMSVDRRDKLAYEWAMNNRGYPDQLELFGINARAGIENAINPITFGAYDDWVHPNWREPMEPVQRGYYSDNGQQVPNWVPNLQSTLLSPR